MQKMIFPVLRTNEYQKSLVLIYLVLDIVNIKYCSEGYDSLICVLEKLGNNQIFLVRSFGVL